MKEQVGPRVTTVDDASGDDLYPVPDPPIGDVAAVFDWLEKHALGIIRGADFSSTETLNSGRALEVLTSSDDLYGSAKQMLNAFVSVTDKGVGDENRTSVDFPMFDVALSFMITCIYAAALTSGQTLDQWISLVSGVEYYRSETVGRWLDDAIDGEAVSAEFLIVAKGDED